LAVNILKIVNRTSTEEFLAALASRKLLSTPRAKMDEFNGVK
jgi:hypothetical protein